jgi:hypothetical protein
MDFDEYFPNGDTLCEDDRDMIISALRKRVMAARIIGVYMISIAVIAAGMIANGITNENYAAFVPAGVILAVYLFLSLRGVVMRTRSLRCIERGDFMWECKPLERVWITRKHKAVFVEGNMKCIPMMRYTDLRSLVKGQTVLVIRFERGIKPLAFLPT